VCLGGKLLCNLLKPQHAAVLQAVFKVGLKAVTLLNGQSISYFSEITIQRLQQTAKKFVRKKRACHSANQQLLILQETAKAYVGERVCKANGQLNFFIVLCFFAFAFAFAHGRNH